MSIVHFEDRVVTFSIPRKLLVALFILAGLALWFGCGYVACDDDSASADFSDFLR